MNTKFLILSILTALSVLAYAQSPMPVIVPANTSGTVQTTSAQANQKTASNTETLDSTIKSLQHTKDVNGELLKTQEATLQQLDDMQKQAEQLKIFSKRG
jgi:hypothetical protein